MFSDVLESAGSVWNRSRESCSVHICCIHSAKSDKDSIAYENIIMVKHLICTS
jgi:hypothetical protein